MIPMKMAEGGDVDCIDIEDNLELEKVLQAVYENDEELARLWPEDVPEERLEDDNEISLQDALQAVIGYNKFAPKSPSNDVEEEYTPPDIVEKWKVRQAEMDRKEREADDRRASAFVKLPRRRRRSSRLRRPRGI